MIERPTIMEQLVRDRVRQLADAPVWLERAKEQYRQHRHFAEIPIEGETGSMYVTQKLDIQTMMAIDKGLQRARFELSEARRGR